MKEKRKIIRIWSQGGLADTNAETYQSRRQQFLNGVLLLQRLQYFKPSNDADGRSLLEVLDRMGRLQETLLTACKAAETLAAADSRISAEKVFILEKIQTIQKPSEGVRENLREAAADGKFISFELIQKIKSAAGSKKTSVETGSESEESPADLRAREQEALILDPIFSLYSHMKGSLRISLQLPDGTVKNTSPSAVNFLFKNSTDPEARISLFNALSACYASNSSVFADILNAVFGAHFLRASRLKLSILDHALSLERMDRQSFEALRAAYEERLPEIQKCLKFMGEFVKTPGHTGSDGKMPVALLGAALPHLKAPEVLGDFASTLKVITESVAGLFPEFSRFIQECREGHWIETHNYSAGSGGAWCLDVPSDSAVAVYMDYQPNLHRAFEAAHILGDAFLKWSTIDLPASERHLSEIRSEFVGRLFEELLLRHLIASDIREEEKAAVLWHGLRRLMINLIEVPFRFRLSELLHEERRENYLSVERINRITRECWETFFSETVKGVDQYMWIRKPHFYNVYIPDSPHHDFQYTVGFLSANAVIRRLTGSSEAQMLSFGKHLLSDCARLSYEEIFSKNFGTDVRQKQFWEEAIETSLLPSSEIRVYAGILSR